MVGQDVVDALCRHVTATLEAGHALESLELEFRLRESVDSASFERLVKSLRGSGALAPEVFTETLEVSVGDGVRFVQTLHPENVPPFQEAKKKRAHVDFIIDGHAARGAVAVEERHDALASLPDPPSGAYRRAKKRWSFSEVKGRYRFDLTRVIASNAPDERDAEDECGLCEIEVELVHNEVFFSETLDHVIKSGIARLEDCVRLMRA